MLDLPEDIGTAVENEISSLVPLIKGLEEQTCRTLHGRYVQMRWSHTDDPDPVTGAVAPDRLTDEAEQYRKILKVEDEGDDQKPKFRIEVVPAPTFANIDWPAATLLRYAVDAYEGPDGEGYIIKCRCTSGGFIYEKSISVGANGTIESEWSRSEPRIL